MNLFDEISAIVADKQPAAPTQFVIVPGHGRVAVGSTISTIRPGRGRVNVVVTAGMGQPACGKVKFN